MFNESVVQPLVLLCKERNIGPLKRIGYALVAAFHLIVKTQVLLQYYSILIIKRDEQCHTNIVKR